MVEPASDRSFLTSFPSRAVEPPWRVRRYRGRLAPSPTGYLHVGHARTFWEAQSRAVAAGGTLVLRNEDLDFSRCRPEFSAAMLEDLNWFGFSWQEGPDRGGRHGPYEQSRRMAHYRSALEILKAKELIYPCSCSRKDVALAARAPHAGEEEPIYPGFCRERRAADEKRLGGGRYCWRFRVSAHGAVGFLDGLRGPQEYFPGIDFGDFVVWRQDELPSYQLAVVVDDALMGITEVVRGADLLLSTARQLLLYRALEWDPPTFAHVSLVTDVTGRRLAKRNDDLSLRTLRLRGWSPEQIRHKWDVPWSLESAPPDGGPRDLR